MEELQLSGNKYADVLIQWGKSYWMETCFDRVQMLKPCPLGATGACCSVCHLGPCRFTQTSEDKVEKGICGDRLSTVTARNLLRMAIMGAGMYMSNAREMVFALKKIANTEEQMNLKIKDPDRLCQLAEYLSIEPDRKHISQLAKTVAEALLQELGRQSGEGWYLRFVPERTVQRWHQCKVVPEGIERELSEAIYRGAFGVEHEVDRILLAAVKVSLAAGWGASMISSILTDIFFADECRAGTSEAGFGVLKEDEVNIVVASHNPILLWSLLHLSAHEEMVEYAKDKGAKRINISNIFCLNAGASHIGGLTHQELCLLTGLVDAIVLDTHCIMPSIVNISHNFHTKVICTSRKAHYPDSEEVLFEPDKATSSAKKIIKIAIDNFPNRTGMGERVIEKFRFKVGPIEDCFKKIQNTSAFYETLAEDLKASRIKGIACLVGCDNPRLLATALHTYLAKEFIKEDILVFSTGCASSAFACAGVLQEDSAEIGSELGKFLQKFDLPPVVHLGNCSENARILMILSQLLQRIPTVDEICKLPVAVISAEWVTEKEITMAFYFSSSGVPVIMGGKSPIKASEEVGEILTNSWQELFGSKIVFEENLERIFDTTVELFESCRETVGWGSSINSKEQTHTQGDRDDGKTQKC